MLIKVDTRLASNENNTYLHFADDTVFDTSGNGLLEFLMPPCGHKVCFRTPTRPTSTSLEHLS